MNHWKILFNIRRSRFQVQSNRISQRKSHSRNGKIFMGGITVGFAYIFHLLKNHYGFLNYPLESQYGVDDDMANYSRYKRLCCWQNVSSVEIGLTNSNRRRGKQYSFTIDRIFDETVEKDGGWLKKMNCTQYDLHVHTFHCRWK